MLEVALQAPRGPNRQVARVFGNRIRPSSGAAGLYRRCFTEAYGLDVVRR